MRHALTLAQRAADAGDVPVGAVVVDASGEVVGEGWNLREARQDPTAHAEVVAMRNACQAVGDFNLAGCVLVSSCEPCPLCLAAALWARVDAIVYAADRHDAARGGFDDLAFYDLFDTPRDQWALPVEQEAVPSASAPFDAWLAKTDRVDY